MKSNIRSFRFSDQVKEILEGFEGDTLNAKFENLVLYCFDKVPQRKKDLEKINQDIAEKREEYWKLCAQMRDIQELISTLERIQYYGQIAERKGKQIAEGYCNTNPDAVQLVAEA